MNVCTHSLLALDATKVANIELCTRASTVLLVPHFFFYDVVGIQGILCFHLLLKCVLGECILPRHESGKIHTSEKKITCAHNKAKWSHSYTIFAYDIDS